MVLLSPWPCRSSNAYVLIKSFKMQICYVENAFDIPVLASSIPNSCICCFGVSDVV